ncbi:DinB family protein [Aporhodopirellula aestuarii]|uniref:DinB family protein n=1 Tax=Aporhodopirellula aestuarii TaxID=2950107 RepID=A0ABT0TZG8_9BACT|nr:DinB family protein [Aporhodopirellula aestuarii]MCM2370008.1 DinB family protein [Aporhodopirellula aestuarii]
MTHKTRRPTQSDLSLEAHWNYVNRIEGECIMKVLADQLYWFCELGSCLSAELIDRVHSPYTWTVRQVVEHCVDAERIFGDRMLRIAAGDETNLPCWDENAYADARFGLGNVGHLISELGHLRQANLVLLGRIVPAAWDRVGTVDSHPITPRGIAWLAAAHVHHHFEIIEKRCDISPQRGPM